VLRIFGPKRDDVIGGWRKTYNEELHNLHSSPDLTRTTVKEDGIDKACSKHEKRRNGYGVLIGKSDETTRKSGSGLEPVAGSCEHGYEPSGSIIC
jgi:hypothetical protein